MLIGMGVFPSIFATAGAKEELIGVKLEPMSPDGLAHAGVTEGHTLFIFVIDNQGTLQGHQRLAANPPPFGQAEEEVITEAT